MAMASMIMQAVQMGSQVGGGIADAIQSKRVANANMRALAIQGDIAEQNAEYEKELIGQTADDVRARQTVNAARSNLDVTQGTPLLAMLDTLTKSETDKSMVRRRLGLTRWQIEMERRAQKFAAAQATLQGVMSVVMPGMKGASALATNPMWRAPASVAQTPTTGGAQGMGGLSDGGGY